jgi:hypothetical protein
MNKRQYFLVAACYLLLPAFLSGCTQYQWQKYGATQSDYNRDLYECQTEAARTYPTQVVTQQTTPGYTMPSTTNCSGTGSAYENSGYVQGNAHVNCTTTPGQQLAGGTSTVDVNADNRAQAAVQCMYARGWQLTQVAQRRDVATIHLNTLTTAPESSVAYEATSENKQRWVRRIAEMNHCTGIPTVILQGTVGQRETYRASCPEKEITVVCEFNGPIHIDSLGFPAVGRQPACWIE